MKRIATLFMIGILAVVGANAQNASQARSILDKAASVVSNKGGASANFTLSSAKMGTISGTIAIKGTMYNARTPQAIVWYNGKTMWTYLKQNEEVNVTTPSKTKQQMMNPYAFINLYRSGYKMSLKSSGSEHTVHLTATGGNKGISEMYITVNKSTYVPSQVKMKQGGSWTTIKVSNFKAKNLSDNTFTFNSKEFPSAEVIDLR